MKKRSLFPYLLALLFSLSTGSISAQYLEAGLAIGGSNYLGDLTPSRLWTSVGDVNLSSGVFVRYNAFDWVSLRATYQYGKINASDADAKNSESRKKRNLSFRSTLHEISLATEINIFGYRPYKKGGSFAPYLFGGVAFFKFNPQAEWDGQWYDLQPLGTEGQGLPGNPEKYKRSQISIPIGLGFKWALSRNVNWGLDVGIRKTFTDYLDDVSTNYPDLEALATANGEIAKILSWRASELHPEATVPRVGLGRGDSDDLDWYLFSQLFISYNFIRSVKGSRHSKKLKCPTF